MLVFTVILALLLVAYCLWKWKILYWQRRGVPCLEGKFPFGSIKDIILINKTIGEAYDDIYYQLGDIPFGGIYRFWWPALFVKDPELIKSVFVKEFNSFHDNDYYVNPKIDPILGLNPFNAKGDRWKDSRGMITPHLTISKVKEMMPGLKMICGQMKEYLITKSDVFLENCDLMGKYTTDAVAISAYGISGNSFLDPNSILRQMSSQLFNSGIKGNIALMCALYAPSLGNILKFKILSEEATDYFSRIVEEAVIQRRKTNTVRSDFLQSLINANVESEAKNNGPTFSVEEMAAHSMTFFLDGYETAALLLGFIMYELSLNPEPQEQLRREILQHGTTLEDFDWEKIHRMEYLDMVVMETLRKHPSGTSFARSCTRDITLTMKDGRSVFVEKGTPVILPMYSLHNDPKYFPEPEKFEPTRFTQDNVKERPQFCFFPFGGGPRSCPGNQFAMTFVKLAVVSVIMNFTLEPKEIPQGKLELDPNNQFFHSAKHGLWTKYTLLKET